jgi:signal transduction histidine kinase
MNATITLKEQRVLDLERLRISRDIHDDLGPRLTEIVVLSELAQRSKARTRDLEAHIRRLSLVAREAARDLNAIIWSVNPRHNSTESLVDYIFGYAEKYLQPASIRCRLDTVEKLPRCPLPSEARHHLFLVVKEALNNVVKYACAAEVKLSFRVEKGALVLAIEDDGRGFCISKGSRSGNGLLNMERRIREIRGHLQIWSRLGEGTRIEVRLPLQSALENADKRLYCRG